MFQSHIIPFYAVQSTMTALYVLIDSQSSNCSMWKFKVTLFTIWWRTSELPYMYWFFPSLSCYMVYYPLVSVLQATAEQIRLAQMIYDKNDADFEDKVNQVRNT